MDDGYEKQPRNILRCPFCGAEVYSRAVTRACYKCNTQMEYMGKEKIK